MDVSLLTLVLDRLVPGSVAMTPAALKHAQSKHSGVGSEGCTLHKVCSALAQPHPARPGAVPRQSRAPRSAPAATETGCLQPLSPAKIREGSPRETFWSFRSNELHLMDLGSLVGSHFSNSRG